MMKNNKRLELNLGTLIELKLSFEEYLILYSLHKRDVEILIDYIENCKKIDTDTYHGLEKKGYILILSSGVEIYHDNLALTEKGRAIFGVVTDEQFKEFRSYYPMVAKQGKKTRRLQGNLSVCKELYRKLLQETTHEVLCKCAKLYNDEKTSSGDQWFFQAMEAWLRQKNYEMYLEDIDKVVDVGQTGGFQDDI